VSSLVYVHTSVYDTIETNFVKERLIEQSPSLWGSTEMTSNDLYRFQQREVVNVRLAFDIR
jgi:hypothetical protein